MRWTIAIALVLAAQTALAQTTDYYGPTGQYLGTGRTQPNPFPDFSGRYGGTTTYTGPGGDYLGSSRTQPNPFPDVGPQPYPNINKPFSTPRRF
jgi:hypothetical protein